jgi:hypothetical protein
MRTPDRLDSRKRSGDFRLSKLTRRIINLVAINVQGKPGAGKDSAQANEKFGKGRPRWAKKKKQLPHRPLCGSSGKASNSSLHADAETLGAPR